MTTYANAERTADAAKGASSPARGSGYRADIQGLRALAVVAVVLDHANIPGFAGGFVGVDVFFVISGFLITQLLLNEAQRTGTISPVQFYSRRARRILPAATLVLVATVFASVLLLGYVQATSIITDSLWATFFAANIKFGRDGTNYFSADNPPSPLQHYWSLAVEEQFYLVWPLLLLLLIVAVTVWRRRRGRSKAAVPRVQGTGYPLPSLRILAVLVLLGGLSLLYSIRLTDRNPTAAYFSTPARAWELALGAICAVLIHHIERLPGWLRAAMAWTGLVAVGVAIFHYTALTPFPGKAALLPVVGTALMIAGGVGAAAGGPSMLLGRKAPRLIGDWSYSLYLWHWPILIVAAGYLQRPLKTSESVLLIVAALAVSALTYYFVENPFRRARHLVRRPRRGLLLYPAAFVITLAACLVAHDQVEHQIAEASDAPPISLAPVPSGHHGAVPPSRPDPAIALVQASVRAAQEGVKVPGHLVPSLLDLRTDIASVGGCDYEVSSRSLCRRGDRSSQKTIVLFGDSHARAWIPAIERIAQQQGFAAYYLVKPGCDAADIVPDQGSGAFQGCVDWRQWAIETIEAMHPDVLVVASDVPPGIVGSNGQRVTDPAALASAFRVGLTVSLADVAPHVGRVVVMGDVPGLDESPGPCLSARGADLGDCAFPPSHHWKLQYDAARQVATDGGYQFIDPVPWFCAHHLCPAVIGATVTYRDTEHITTEYAADLAGPLEKLLLLPSER